VGPQRVWPVALEVAVTTDDAIYVSATASGTSLFVLAGTGNRATLWLRQDQRVVTATPAEILEAVVGVSLSPGQLLGMLTGCATRAADVAASARYKNALAIKTSDGRVFLSQVAGHWQIAAAITDRFTVEFGRRPGQKPDDVWIWSSPAAALDASLHLAVSDGQVNGPIPPTVFQVPAGASSASPMTIDELRAAGAWKGRQPDPERRAWPGH
jgi:hypothetical protein